MVFNINEFRASLQFDGARPNYFAVSLAFPGGVIGGSAAGRTSQFLCKSASLPTVTLGLAPVSYFGREVKLPGNAEYADWTITIYNDEDFLIRNAFESWTNFINSHAGNIRDPAFLTPLGYSVPASVIQFGKTGNAIKQYDFVGMWPAEVSPIELDWGSNNEVEEFSVTFQYQYWTSTFPIQVTDF